MQVPSMLLQHPGELSAGGSTVCGLGRKLHYKTQAFSPSSEVGMIALLLLSQMPSSITKMTAEEAGANQRGVTQCWKQPKVAKRAGPDHWPYHDCYQCHRSATVKQKKKTQRSSLQSSFTAVIRTIRNFTLWLQRIFFLQYI